MSTILTNPKYAKQRCQKPPFILNLILFFLQIKISISVVENSCYQVYDYENEDCFNDKIKFHNNFRAGHFVTLKDGSLIIEYSSDAVNYERFFWISCNSVVVVQILVLNIYSFSLLVSPLK